MNLTTAILSLFLATAGLAPDVPPAREGRPTDDGDHEASVVVKYQGTETKLADRWSWAKAEAGRQSFSKGYWIGYSIEKTMGERSFIGSFHSDDKQNHPSLGEIVTGVRANDLPPYPSGEFGTMSGFVTYDDEKKPAKLLKKEVGILFHIDGGSKGEIDDVEISNFSLRVRLEGEPLVWIGPSNPEESVALLESRYRDAPTTDAKKRFVVAVGVHDETPRALEFLKEVLTGSGDRDLRGDAAFWLGQTDREPALVTLKDVAWNDESEDVREKCVFAMTQMTSEASTDALIGIAREHKSTETRKDATFWLGQRASEKAVGALKDLAYDDDNSEVQRSAIFALTQVDDGLGAVDELIKIARQHPNPKVRKDAIFWLGQSDDPKAVDALVEMVKGK